MDGHAGNQQQVPLHVTEHALDALLRADSQAPRHRQGTVRPQGQLHAAVDLGIQPGVLILHPQLRVFLDFKAGGIPVRGHGGKGAEVSLRHLEGDQGAHAPGGKIPASRLQGPGVGL